MGLGKHSPLKKYVTTLMSRPQTPDGTDPPGHAVVSGVKHGLNEAVGCGGGRSVLINHLARVRPHSGFVYHMLL